MQTLLASYETLDRANDAVNALVAAGHDRSDIGLAVLDREGKLSRHLDESGNVRDDVSGGEGVGFGAVIGTLVGALAGLVAITIPGIGPILAAGPLSALGGAAAGAGIGALTGGVTGGVTAALVDFGVPREEAGAYEEALRRGSALVTVTIKDGNVQGARSILERYDPMDIDERRTQWLKDSAASTDPMAEPFTAVDRERHNLEGGSQGSSSSTVHGSEDMSDRSGMPGGLSNSTGSSNSTGNTGFPGTMSSSDVGVTNDEGRVRVYNRD